MRAEKIRHIVTVTILAAFLAALMSLFVLAPRVPTVEAQSGGGGTFSQVINAPSSGSTAYFPVNNRNQIAATVIITAPAVNTNCSDFLDASTDGTHYFTLSAGTFNPLGQGSLTLAANGYFPFYRLKVAACSVAQTLTYIGYGFSLPLEPLVTDTDSYFTTPVGGSNFPLIVEGFQCYNSNSSVAFVQFMFTPTSSAPTLGTDTYMDFAIPGSSLFSYPGKPFSAYSVTGTTLNSYIWYGASTAWRGSTAVTDAVYCNFQFNTTGPFAPFFVPSS